MTPHLKKSKPEVWAEIVATCQEAANAGEIPAEAFRRVRHFGFGYASFIKWIDAGVIPSSSRDGQKWKPIQRYM